MHFHLPKPLHGWREFAGEIGIIVVGVLIALSAEQFAEFVNDRAQVRHGEEALSDNFRRFVTYTAELDAYAPCIGHFAGDHPRRSWPSHIVFADRDVGDRHLRRCKG
jgi:hypothetical protein